MIRRHVFSAAAALSVFSLTPQPLAAQEPAADNAAQMDDLMQAMAGMFQAEPLTPAQEMRLPAATALVSVMMPEGFYAEMMGEMMDGMFGPMTSMFSGETGAGLLLQSRLSVAPETLDALTAEERIELATLLDPGFAQRGQVMGDLMRGVMAEAAVVIEPLYREGLSKAYAARFDEAQLADIGAFFATPTGRAYAGESMKLMADPQVMGATMQALPAMMGGMGDIMADLETKMAALPAEKAWSDLTAAERARMATILDVGESELGDNVRDPAPRQTSGT